MSDEGGTGGKLGQILLWLVTVVFGVAMFGAGATKFVASQTWIDLFHGWGYATWFVYVIGTLEVVAAASFFVPRFATYAASLIVAIMVGAAVTVMTHPGQMGPVVPLVNVVAFSIVGYLRRDVRWKPS